ncbi:CLUMA_CG008846, isoform A [Clunio marinus]|uniref:CLUMA_CG008846, isoform A n=1 Tax=Clunio marinus TaxID=568069 RepID=A0A1J1I9T4_9DIPT|nr:CLUMA_CG008846, isoform A [Clunio marinus]
MSADVFMQTMRKIQNTFTVKQQQQKIRKNGCYTIRQNDVHQFNAFLSFVVNNENLFNTFQHTAIQQLYVMQTSSSYSSFKSFIIKSPFELEMFVNNVRDENVQNFLDQLQSFKNLSHTHILDMRMFSPLNVSGDISFSCWNACSSSMRFLPDKGP